jgi:uncharacterized UBP type Zn finger protein
MNTQLAMEWLIEHGDDADIDEPIAEEELEEIKQYLICILFSNYVREDAEFVANPEAVEKLKDMGFAEDQITTALRVCNNNSEAAAAWLLGDRDVAEMVKTIKKIIIFAERSCIRNGRFQFDSCSS